MNTKTSSKQTLAIFKNDIRCFWRFSLIGTIIIFAALFIAINRIVNGMESRDFILFTLFAASLIYPLVSSVAVFRYLFDKKAHTFMHSLPSNRKSHFIGHAAAGYVLAALPVIMGMIAVLIMAQTDFVQDEQVFYGISLWNYTVSLVLIALKAFTFCTLAAFIAGTSFMQVLLTMGLSLVLTLISDFLETLGRCYLSGFDRFSTMNTFTYLLYPNSSPSALSDMRDLVLCCALLYLAYVLYRKRSLENTGSSYIFSRPSSWELALISICITAIIYVFQWDGLLSHPACVLGIALIIYILFALPSYGVKELFRGKELKALIIYACVLVVTIGVFAFDVLGFEKNLPDKNRIESAAIDCYYTLDTATGSESSETTIKFKSPDAIESILSLNEELASNALPEKDSDYRNDDFTITYNMKNGAQLVRKYRVPDRALQKSSIYKTLYETDDFKKAFLLKDNAYFTTDYYEDEIKLSIVPVITGDDVYIPATLSPGLVKAVDKDTLARTYTQESANDIIGIIHFEHTRHSSGWTFSFGDDEEESFDDEVSIPVRMTDKNTIDYLKKHDLYDKIDPDPIAITKIEVTLYDNDDYDSSVHAIIYPDELGIDNLTSYIEKYGLLTTEHGRYDTNIYLKNTITGKKYELWTDYSMKNPPSYFKNLEWKNIEE